MHLPSQLPIFPLPEQVLLPNMPTAYRIFEPRYMALVMDLQQQPESSRWLAVPCLRAGWQVDYAGSPPFQAIAAAGLVRRIAAASGQEFHIVVEGLVRCELSEVASHRLYRAAAPHPCEDLIEIGFDVRRGFAELLSHIAELGDRLRVDQVVVGQFMDEGIDRTVLLNRLAHILISDPQQRQAWLECRHLSRRLRLVQEAALLLQQSAPLPPGQRWRPSEN